jgi:hypothetical protein
MLKHGTEYRELGADYFDRIEPQRLARSSTSNRRAVVHYGFALVSRQGDKPQRTQSEMGL